MNRRKYGMAFPYGCTKKDGFMNNPAGWIWVYIGSGVGPTYVWHYKMVRK